jgi:type IV pilus assembly protein PilE
MLTKSRRSGFTLPEILVTVTVIAVLAAVVVPSVTQYTNKGDTPSTLQDLDELRTATTAYTADVRSYPAYLLSLEVDPSVTNWKGPYTQAPLSTAVATTATFTTNGLKIVFGPALTKGTTGVNAGFLYTPVTLTSANGYTTCQDLYDLDKKIDASAVGAGSYTGATTGALVWTSGAGGCAVTGQSASLVSTATITFNLIPTGS